MLERRILAIGVFDLFHVGHLRYLEYAKRQGSHLIVAVTTDAIGVIVKGKRPQIPEDQRLEIVAALNCVDDARRLPCPTEYHKEAAVWIANWSIHHVVAGGGWSGSPRWNRLIPELAKRDISVSFAPTTEGISTTDIIARIQQRCTNGNPPHIAETSTGR
jgi:glycerol-3-phosphate cytidylyltransferase